MYKNILKSIGSVLAGFFTVAVLSIATDMALEKSGVFPPQNEPAAYTAWMLLLALIYRSIYTVGGGYITAMLAPNRPMRHVAVLGIIGTVLATLGAAANWEKAIAAGTWYPVALILLALPSVWLGGKLKLKKRA